MKRDDVKPDRIVFLRARIASDVSDDFGVPMVLLEPVDKAGAVVDGAWTHWVEIRHLVPLEEARAALERRARRCDASQ